MIPLVPSTGVTVNGIPLHEVAVIAVTEGAGFMVTVTVKVGPVQPTAVLGVTV